MILDVMLISHDVPMTDGGRCVMASDPRRPGCVVWGPSAEYVTDAMRKARAIWDATPDADADRVPYPATWTL